LVRAGAAYWVTLFAQTIAVLLVGYLAFLRPSVMTLALLLYECGTINVIGFGRSITSLPDWAFTPLALAFVALFGAFPSAALASFAVRFPQGRLAGWRLRFARVIDAIVVTAFFVGITAAIMGIGISAAPYTLSAYAALVLIVSIVSLAKAEPKERGRIAVVFAGTMCSAIAYNALVVYWLVNGQHDTPVLSWGMAIAPAILPLAVAYGILRHRIFDIGFIVNRALVYGATSAILVIMIEGLEFVAERFVQAETHVESALVEFVITLAVVLCIRPVHRRVDRAVDNLFFRTRHEQESALLRFATTAQFYTDASPLVRDGIEAVVRFGKVHAAAVYLPGPAGASCNASTFASNVRFVDENDPALVELRAHGEVLDTHNRRTALPGVRLYPMMLAGRLVGVLAAGERESGEEMPPDIDAAVRAVAASIGVTLEAIETVHLRAENAGLRGRGRVAEGTRV
jgi:hypothetical protein